MVKATVPTSGTALIYNASGATISHVAIGTVFSQAVTIAALPLLPGSQSEGSSSLSGISFPLPVGNSFNVTINFDTGARVTGTVNNISHAAPAFYLVAFTNGIVVTNPTGRATQIFFDRSIGLITRVAEEL